MKFTSLFLFFFFNYHFLYAQPSSGSSDTGIRLTDSVRCTSVKDQNSSPTCWVFGSNSLFESDVMKKTGKELNLSEMFIARYAYIDKINAYLASKGKTYCEGGGQFHDVIRVISRYGMAPEEVYNGRPNGETYHNHAGLDISLKKIFKRLLAESKTHLEQNDLKQVNDTLDHYLGKVPATFIYDGKTYTPKTFAEEIVKFGNDYVELMSFADLPSYKKCLLVDKFNWAGDSLYNIPLDDFQNLVDTAIANGWSVGWEGDVTNPFFSSLSGFAASPLTYNNYESIRVFNYKNENTERDHMLHMVGIGKDRDNKKLYYLKNSWGTWFSHFKGFLYMDENYFKMNTVILMVNKAGLPQSLKEKLGF